MTHHAPRRRDYQDARSRRAKPGPRDVDSADRLLRIKAGLWSLAVVWIATAAGALVGAPLTLVFPAALVAGAAVYFLTMRLTEGAGGAAQVVYNPSGDSTPYKRDYSYAEALAKRGNYGDAAQAYELYALEYSDDPEPYLRLARLYRDRLNQYEDAVTWFRRARADARLSPGQHLLVMQELIEIYTRRLKMPRKAMPELALMCERFPGTPQAEAAARELAEMREMLERERHQMIPFTVQFLQKAGRGSVATAAGDTVRELERHMVREALAQAGGDKAKAAALLGVTVGELDEKLG